MMKQQLSASSLRPSRLCQLLLCALVIKIGILCYLSFDSLISKAFNSNGNGIAYAAEAPGAPAAPAAIQAPLPDIGIDRPTPGTMANPTIPGAVPGNTAPIQAGVNGTSKSQPAKSRVLPGLGSRSNGIGTASSQNSTAPQDDALRLSLLKQQEELARKEESLKRMEKELESKMEQMQVLESRLNIMMKDAAQAQDTKTRQLVDVLSNMKAAQAAKVLETLDQRIGVKVLSNMRGRQAGEILTFVNPKKAASMVEALSRMQLPLE